MPMEFVENFEEFRIRQKCDFIYDKKTERHLFRNGALINSMGRFDPPRNEFDRLQLIREFLVVKHAEQVKLFKTIQDEVMEVAANFLKYGNTPPPNPQAPDALRRIRAAVLQMRKEIAEIDAKRTKKPENEYLARQDAMKQERASEAMAILEKVKGISL